MYLGLIATLYFPQNSLANDQVTAKNSSGQATLLILGDSLSASFGIEQSQGWVSLLSRKLDNHQYRMRVVNASISGETTQGGLQRLPTLLEKHKPAMVIIELGGNDGLRGLNLSMIESNLREIIKLLKRDTAKIVLTGIRLPPNYGQVYTEKFYQVFQNLARQENVPLVPFIMEGVATDNSLMQADGIHPTAEAQPVLLENMWKVIEPLLNQQRTSTMSK